MAKLRVVIDTNVVAAAAKESKNCTEVIERALRDHDVLTSKEMLEELRDVAGRPKFVTVSKRFALLVGHMVSNCTVVEGHIPDLPLLPDPDDGMVLNTALAGGADFIVTGNLRHFPEGLYGSVRVVSPRVFLDFVRSAESAPHPP